MYRLLLVTMLAAQAGVGVESSKGSPDGYVLWDAARVEAAADRLEARLGNEAMVYETIGNYEGHSIYLVLRGRTGSAELHETESDLYIAKRGRATFAVGGELVEPQTLPRRQRRGSAILGGTRQALAPGDIVHVPEGVPHQLILDANEPFMYLLIKFDEEPLTGER
jgi:mannose-6-phosphate isomerase-like protein (cupin superfamily)